MPSPVEPLTTSEASHRQHVPNLRRSFAARIRRVAGGDTNAGGIWSRARSRPILLIRLLIVRPNVGSLSVVMTTDQPRSGESFHMWHIKRPDVETLSRRSISFMRRKMARMGDKISTVFPPPRTMGSAGAMLWWVLFVCGGCE